MRVSKANNWNSNYVRNCVSDWLYKITDNKPKCETLAWYNQFTLDTLDIRDILDILDTLDILDILDIHDIIEIFN